jgi:hypothetical protein
MKRSTVSSSLERSSAQLGEKVRHSQKKPVEYRGSRDCLTFLLSYSNSNMFGFPYGAPAILYH